ncbi:MAG: T9SS type A sorting domain-containing protein [candidate division KSB1 bacterium]|nr:T9SS type A sorting domain-containing protein [candidate division KSB1 bacterium]MDZ7276539.1 T9SS type A sorting domain-containing protein [candidate division KSB1 bacterium]MDZ7285043.1 T9SS type A sorting domain-containing protein [candidate division KSB1 bacterium]MDZ7298075.1 T9SS type A sorting domain-containing protein [candidate division KSB1 bacterium]MDZ7307699.1 T9SS type A sorting domain-containing protein [candidate division KSB1 bacterium]
MRKLFTAMLCLSFALTAFAGTGARHFLHKIDKARQPQMIRGDEPIPAAKTTRALHKTNAIGPGVLLMESTYDYGSNGGVLSNIVDYGDGTLAIGRMGATDAGTNDRGTYFSYFDGTSWSPMTKVEQVRRGWSSISALADGRSVTVSHIANEVNVDALKGLGIWTSTITGNISAASDQWPRLTVDGKDNIIICSTTNATVPPVTGVRLIKSVAVSRDQGATWSFQFLWPDTTTRTPAFSADDQDIASQGDNVAVVVAETGNDIHLWTSSDNATTWTYQNLTNNPTTLPPGTSADLPAGSCDVIYDKNGNLHIFWETYTGLPDSAGTGIDLYESTSAGIYHWSAATGITEVVDFSDIPGSDQEINVFAGGLGAFQQHNIDGNVVCQPSAGVDADNNLYLLFASFRPNDVDPDSAHYTDIYAIGSADGGANWGPVLNVTDSPQAEDTWASLAVDVGDSLRFVYSSDGSTGNSIQGDGVAPTNYLYHAVPKSKVVLTSVNDRPVSGVPASFALHQNFPNPFNPATTLTFEVAKPAEVNLSVFDVHGRLVATLVNGLVQAGKHTLTWKPAKNLSSGVYFAKLQSDGFSQVTKMTLMK